MLNCVVSYLYIQYRMVNSILGLVLGHLCVFNFVLTLIDEVIIFFNFNTNVW